MGFLAYPGDPEIYHAKFVIRVVASEQSLLPCTLTAHARTSHGTRKRMVVAYTSEKFFYINQIQNNNKEGKIKNETRFEKFLLNKRIIQLGNHSISILYISFSPDLAA